EQRSLAKGSGAGQTSERSSSGCGRAFLQPPSPFLRRSYPFAMKLATVAEMQLAERDVHTGVQGAEPLAGGFRGCPTEFKNTSGDGLVAARHLKDWGADVTGVLLKPRGEDDANLKALVERDVPVVVIDDDVAKLGEALTGAELMIDALLGTGRARPIEGPLAGVLDKLRDTRSRRLPPRLLAVDLPTGLDADTGAIDPHTVAADQTVALGWSKVGLHTLPGAQYAGRVEVVDIGISPEFGSSIQTELMTASWARSTLPERPPGAHKGTFG